MQTAAALIDRSRFTGRAVSAAWSADLDDDLRYCARSRVTDGMAVSFSGAGWSVRLDLTPAISGLQVEAARTNDAYLSRVAADALTGSADAVAICIGYLDAAAMGD